ncbi:cys-loop ligand-gated ion channel-like isoform X3 [Tubulanus polymorphus]|uniref:cys-loop ligand-gated ion channel-like isoform X3 n=1 Tax=Tubulanus polymorphus TaxID=672921 RepID=UPI003DA51A55
MVIYKMPSNTTNNNDYDPEEDFKYRTGSARNGPRTFVMDSNLTSSLIHLQSSIDKFTELYSRIAHKQLLADTGKKQPQRSQSLASYPPDLRDEKVVVALRMVFLKIGEIDTLKENYTADIFLYATWPEESLDGWDDKIDINTVDYSKYWNPKLVVENTYSDEPKEDIWQSVQFDNNGKATMVEKRRLKGTFAENLELKHFPFDTQDLSITVASERSDKELDLVEDPNKLSCINVQTFVDAQEWDLHSHVEVNKKSSLKEFSGTPYRSPAMVFTCRAGRRPGFFIWNILLVMFFICCLIFATFSVNEELVQNRLQLSFTLVLTAVAFKFVVNQSLPKISYLTYLDKYILVSMTLLILVNFWHAIVHRLLFKQIANGKFTIDQVTRADTWAIITFGILFALFHVLFILHIYFGALKRRREMIRKDQEYKITFDV